MNQEPNSEAAETAQITETPAVDLSRIVRPFWMRSITVGGKYLTHDNIVAAAEYFLEQRRLYLKECLRANMAEQAALGEQFTPEEWRASLDDSQPNETSPSVGATEK